MRRDGAGLAGGVVGTAEDNAEFTAGNIALATADAGLDAACCVQGAAADAGPIAAGGVAVAAADARYKTAGGVL